MDALDLLAKDYGIKNFIFFGIRIGAFIALKLKKYNPIQYLFWSPVFDLNYYIGEIFRRNLAFQMATFREIIHSRDALVKILSENGKINYNGHIITSQQYHEFTNQKVDIESMILKLNVNVVDIGRNENTNAKFSQNIAEICQKNTEKSKYLFIKAEPFWDEMKFFKDSLEEAEQVSIEWLNEKK